MKQTVSRQTKYSIAIQDALANLHHATNSQLHQELVQTYPEVSATTVHRATSRLAEQGNIALAPADSQGAVRFDSNLAEHDHFICTTCGGMRDVDVASKLLSTINQSLDGCVVTGRLVINGSCQSCLITNVEETV